MYNSLLSLVALCFGASFLLVGGGKAESDPVRELYEFEVVIKKGEKMVSYEQAIFSQIMLGAKATFTKDGVEIPLKYTGLGNAEHSNGELTGHTFAYVTQDNNMVIDAYRKDCGNLEINSVWPPEKSTYTVANSNCTLTMSISIVN